MKNKDSEYQQVICHVCEYPHPAPMVPERDPPVIVGTHDPATGIVTGGDGRPHILKCWFQELLMAMPTTVHVHTKEDE